MAYMPSPAPIIHDNEISKTEQKAINAAILAGTKFGLGYLRVEPIPGIAYFKFKALNDLILHIPRRYILFKPKRPNGYIEAINLLFHWPMMHVSQRNLNTPILREKYPLTLAVLLARHSPCSKKTMSCDTNRNKGYFASRYTPYAGDMPSLPWLTDECVLQEGKWDNQTGLIRYELVHLMQKKYTKKVDTLYFKAGSNPYHSSEWIHCESSSCEYNWFRNGLWVKVLFEHVLLPQHMEIRSKIDAQINAFITKK
jgi:hypothetical protein